MTNHYGAPCYGLTLGTIIHGAIKNEGYFEIINEAEQKVVCPVPFRQTKQIQTLMIFFRLDIKIIDK